MDEIRLRIDDRHFPIARRGKSRMEFNSFILSALSVWKTVRWRVRRNVVEEPLATRRLRGVRWARRNINRMWEHECLSERYAISLLPLGFLWHRQSPSALLHFNHRAVLVSIAYLIGRYRNMISHMKYSVALCPAPRQRTHVAIVPILFM